MIFLIDHNLKGHSVILLGAIASQDWLEIIPIRFVTFVEIGLPINSDDRVVWRAAQENEMILLTANRSMKGKNSLEEVMRQENTSDSLPVITISQVDRLLDTSEYRNRCIERLIEVVLDIDSYRGARRIFIP